MIRLLVSWDSHICIHMTRWHGKKYINKLMYFFSRLGDGYFYAIITILLVAIQPSKLYTLLPAGIIGFTFEVVLHLIIKRKIKRNRPFLVINEIRNLIKPPDKFSFPSGHTAAAFVMATILSFFYPAMMLPCFTIAALIGFSRIYNGVHYPSDVLAGVILGVVSAKIGLIVI